MIHMGYIEEMTINARYFNEINAAIDGAITLAREISYHDDWISNKGGAVKFDFNGVMVTVRMDSDPELIFRDWSRAMFGYIDKNVGPYPNLVLSDEEKESYRHTKSDIKRKAVIAKLATAPQVVFANKDFWEESFPVIENAVYSMTGPFSNKCMMAIVDYSERWARLMQMRLINAETLEDIAQETSHEANIDGVSITMHFHAVWLLSGSWKYGEELRLWHNKKCGVSKDTGDVVDPSLIR